MKCTTYVDESGNTGDDLNSQDQKYFILGAVTIPDNKIQECLCAIDNAFFEAREKGEMEIKAIRWVNSRKKRNAMQRILDYLKKINACFSLVLIEKRYMISAIIVDNFMDGAYNDTKDYTWVSNSEDKKAAAQYFYDLLPDEEIHTIFEAFRHPEFDTLSDALQRVIKYTKHHRYLRMLEGCVSHLKELYETDVSIASEIGGAGVGRSPNYTAFATLGCSLAKQCRNQNNTTEILFDHSSLVDHAYEDLFKIFSGMEINPQIEKQPKIVSWKGLITNFNVSDSKANRLLQTADIFVSSSLKTIRKILKEDLSRWNDYDNYIKHLLAYIFINGGFINVMEDNKCRSIVTALIKDVD